MRNTLMPVLLSFVFSSNACCDCVPSWPKRQEGVLSERPVLRCLFLHGTASRCGTLTWPSPVSVSRLPTLALLWESTSQTTWTSARAAIAADVNYEFVECQNMHLRIRRLQASDFKKTIDKCGWKYWKTRNRLANWWNVKKIWIENWSSVKQWNYKIVEYYKPDMRTSRPSQTWIPKLLDASILICELVGCNNIDLRNCHRQKGIAEFVEWLHTEWWIRGMTQWWMKRMMNAKFIMRAFVERDVLVECQHRHIWWKLQYWMANLLIVDWRICWMAKYWIENWLTDKICN